MARHGGGAFSGKDPSKVDRSCRLRRPLCRQEHRGGRPGRSLRNPGLLRHRRGRAHLDLGQPFGTATVAEERIVDLVREHFDLRPKGLIDMLDLKRPIYFKTAAYGHFGREEPEFTWEKTDKADALRASA
jgi:S-adenosylmethionine synthetase